MTDRNVYKNYGKVYKVTVIYVMHLKNSEFWFEVFFFLISRNRCFERVKVTVQTNNLVF